jgi:hypothetical protein
MVLMYRLIIFFSPKNKSSAQGYKNNDLNNILKKQASSLSAQHYSKGGEKCSSNGRL